MVGFIAAPGKSGTARRRKPNVPSLSMIAASTTGPRRRRLDVRVGQPGMERKHRHLHREREEEGAEEPHAGLRSEPHLRHDRVVGEVRNHLHRAVDHHRGAIHQVWLPGGEPQVDDGDEHQQRAEHRVDEELEARVDAALAAPDADDEIHRDEHDLPHHVEQEEIARQEDAEHSRGQHEEQRVVGGGVFWRTDVQLPIAESNMMKVVSSTIISAMPSRPSVKRAPHDGIHAMSNRCCQPVTAGSNAHQRPTESTNSMAKTIVASERGRWPRQ